MIGVAGPAYVGAMRLRRLTGTITATTQNPSFPVSNLLDYTHPVQRWEASTIGEERIVIDLGAARQIGLFYLGWADFGGATTCRFEANSANSWTAPVYSKEIPTQKTWHPLTKRGHYAHLPPDDALDTLNLRYASLVIPAHTGLPVKIGQFEILDQGGCLIPQRPPLGYGWKQAVAQTDKPTGTRARVLLGPRLATYALDWEYAYNYLDDGGESEDGILEDENLHADPDDRILVVRDTAVLPHFAAICDVQDGDTTIQSSAGVGATLPRGYQEIC